MARAGDESKGTRDPDAKPAWRATASTRRAREGTRHVPRTGPQKAPNRRAAGTRHGQQGARTHVAEHGRFDECGVFLAEVAAGDEDVLGVCTHHDTTGFVAEQCKADFLAVWLFEVGSADPLADAGVDTTAQATVGRDGDGEVFVTGFGLETGLFEQGCFVDNTPHKRGSLRTPRTHKTTRGRACM